MDERKLRIYAFLVWLGRLALDDVPEPYRGELAVQ